MYDDLIKDKVAVVKKVTGKGNIFKKCKSCAKYKAIDIFSYDDEHDILSDVCDECKAKKATVFI